MSGYIYTRDKTTYREDATSVIDNIENDVQSALNVLQKALKEIDGDLGCGEVEAAIGMLENLLHKLA